MFTGINGIGVAPIGAGGAIDIDRASWLLAGNYFSPRVGDLDGDGANDIAAVSLDTDAAVVLWNDGHGAFPDALLLTTQPQPEDVAIGDLTATGVPISP